MGIDYELVLYCVVYIDTQTNLIWLRSVAQSTYLTLFTAETSPETLGAVIQDMIVGSSMVGIDEELKQLLEDGE
jgi:hypothetical protein